MSGHRVLLLEDDASLGAVLQEHLQMQGFTVTLCTDGVQGSQAFKANEFDICLVDIMMPRKDGFSFAEDVRRTDSEIPLIFLTAKAMKEDKIQGFKAGCDDYVTKPFSIEELMLRIQAVMRRRRKPTEAESPTSFEIGSYSFDYPRQLLTRNEQQRKLTPREADLLRLLCQSVNRTVRREDALKQIWNDDGYFAGRSMDVFISKLRKHLKDDPRVEILGIHGKGVRLVVG
ncbi:MAG: response regulator transcription factor [candidate division Zixibacteria bacterium]|nr:response regulator transcription factor [candidate division Zixibacteria bacterium]MDH3937012.1 response regulator transcription factor [candidate division Zixibacteria bacterium]MDH4033848.1 response regulator transcription factor [candidate division Zixibacteria bacterium]